MRHAVVAKIHNITIRRWRQVEKKMETESELWWGLDHSTGVGGDTRPEISLTTLMLAKIRSERSRRDVRILLLLGL